MKVSELVAEIKFDIDTKNLDVLSNKLKKISNTISGGFSKLEKIKETAGEVGQKINAVTYSESSGARSAAQSSFLGNLFSSLIKSLEHSLLKAFKYLARNIVSGIKNTFKDIMAYRDYRSFTGRNAKEVSDIMAMTAFTTSMRPQDIMEDAKDLGKKYWDIFFGKASPEAYLRLGVLPTGNGQKDLRSILSAILNVTGNLANRGLALSLLGQFGLNEEYMTILEKMSEGKSLPEVYNITDKQLSELEETNTAMRQFRQNIEQFQKDLLSIWNDGLKDILVFFLERLRTLVALMQGGALKGKSISEAGKMAWDVLTTENPNVLRYEQATGKYVSDKSKMSIWDNTRIMAEKFEKGLAYGTLRFANAFGQIPGAMIGVPEAPFFSYDDFIRETGYPVLSSIQEQKRMEKAAQDVEINNFFDLKGQSADYASKIQSNVVGNSVKQIDLNSTNYNSKTWWTGGNE